MLIGVLFFSQGSPLAIVWFCWRLMSLGKVIVVVLMRVHFVEDSL